MPTKTIYCPRCFASLSVNVGASQLVKCSKCNYIGDLATYSERPLKREDSGTDIVDSSGFYKPAKLEMIKDDGTWISGCPKSITLKRGINTLGRQSDNSQSNTQFPTTDPFMSKNHAAIDVIYKSRTATFEHSLSDNHSMNHTYLNGTPLESGDIIVLKKGDEIRLGHTIFKLINE